jgi:Lipocalin-like domain
MTLLGMELNKQLASINRRKKMNALTSRVLVAAYVLLLFGGVSLHGAEANLTQQIVGTWAVVSSIHERDGKKTEPLGSHPVGYYMFDQAGHYSLQSMRSDLPKFASNNKSAGTDAENKAVVQGINTIFGTYTVNEKEHSVTVHIIGGSFPNWAGADQKRVVAINGDTLTWTVAMGPAGSTVITLQRAK